MDPGEESVPTLGAHFRGPAGRVVGEKETSSPPEMLEVERKTDTPPPL